MTRKRHFFKILVVFLAANFLCITAAGADTGPYSLQGQVIVPDEQFLSSFDLALLRDGVREVGRVRVTSMTHFQFTGLAAGTYVLMVNIPGFKEVRESFNIRGPLLETNTNIVVERLKTPAPGRSDVTSVREYDADNLIAASDLGKYPHDLQEELETAQQELRQRNLDRALRRLDKIVDQFPEYYPARRDRGVVYQKLGRYLDARSDYDIARGLNSSSPTPLIYLAGLSLLEARSASSRDTERALIRDALDSLLKAVDIWPWSSFAHYLLGVTYYEAEFYEDAEDNFLQALNLDPQLVETHLGLANLYIKMRKWDNALSHLDTYLAESERPEEPDKLRTVRSRVQNVIESEEDSLQEKVQDDD